ncbi:MAG: DUF1294 domain-containing protein [Ruminococcaceae bacterium]|nr:DUF1294 domain-containing protein [Oscillospiraceae bacterium]
MWYYLAAISLISVVLCVYDKVSARHRGRRVPEKTLFGVSALGGALCMFITMLLIRHKTKHFSFMFFVPLMALVHIALIICFGAKLGLF